MTAQDMIRRLAEANPVPEAGHLHSDPVDAERLFSSIERRRDEMIDPQTRPTSSPPPVHQSKSWYRNPAVVVVIAVAAVLIAAVPLVIFARGESDMAGTPATTAREPGATTTIPATTVPTTVPSEAPVVEQPFEATRWELVTPRLDPGAASAAAFERVVATDFGFVAISGTVGDGIWTSPDGVEWTEVSDPFDPVGLGVGVDFYDLAVNGDRIAAVISNSWDGTAGIATSSDAENWTFTVLSQSSEGNPDPAYPMSVAAYGTDGFIVSGSAIWLSTDGAEYELVEVDALDPVWASASDGQTVVLGTSFAELLVTQNGETWDLIPQLVGIDGEEQPCSTSLEALAHGPAGFVAVGSCGPYGTAWTSPDGVVWAQIPYDEAAFGEPAWPHTIDASERGYVVGGSAGPDGELRAATVWTSPDGIHWTRVVLDTAEVESGVLGVAVHDKTLVAIGWRGDEAAIWRAVLAS